MNSKNGARRIVSKTLFISQVSAISIDGISIALISFLASERLQGMLLLLAIAAMIAVVHVYRLPIYFAELLSLRALSFMAIIFSLFAITIAVLDASTYVGLPESFGYSPGIRDLKTVTIIRMVSFTLALIANIIAVILAPRRQGTVSS